MAVPISPLSGAVGVQIPGLGSAAFRDRSVAHLCLEMLSSRGVVVFPEAHIINSDLVSFSRMLGTLATAGVRSHPQFSGISAISSDPAVDERASWRQSSAYWHADGFTSAQPHRATLLAARAIADDGGETDFASTYLAFDALPDSKKDALESYRVRHSVAASLSLIHPHATEPERKRWECLPAWEHPLVWRRKDGRRSLAIGATAESVKYMSDSDSRILLDGLLAWSTKKCFALRHRWRVGDLVVWDNTGVLHRTIPHCRASRPSMQRTFIAGDEVVR